MALTPLKRTVDEAGLALRIRRCAVESRGAHRDDDGSRAGVRALTIRWRELLAAGASWWPLQMARELDDAILTLRTNELDLGLWIIKTAGNPEAVLATDEFHFESPGQLVRARSSGNDAADIRADGCYFALDVRNRRAGIVFCGDAIGIGACGGPDLHARLAGRRKRGRRSTLSRMNFGPLPMVNGLSRLAARFYQDAAQIEIAAEIDWAKSLRLTKRWRRGS